MKPLRTVALFSPTSPTPYDLAQARRWIIYHLVHGNWHIMTTDSDPLRSMVEHWCIGRLYTIASQRAVLSQAERVVCISRPDVARLAVLRGREAWLIDSGRQIIPRPLKGLWSAA